MNCPWALCSPAHLISATTSKYSVWEFTHLLNYHFLSYHISSFVFSFNHLSCIIIRLVSPPSVLSSIFLRVYIWIRETPGRLQIIIILPQWRFSPAVPFCALFFTYPPSNYPPFPFSLSFSLSVPSFGSPFPPLSNTLDALPLETNSWLSAFGCTIFAPLTFCAFIATLYLLLCSSNVPLSASDVFGPTYRT